MSYPDHKWVPRSKRSGDCVISVGHGDNGLCAAYVHVPCGRYCFKSWHNNVPCVGTDHISISGTPLGHNKLYEETSMSNVLQRVRDFAIGEPLKSYVKYGIKTEDGHLTEDGVSILLDVLSDKFDTELQAVVKQLTADDKANKSK